MFFKILGLFFGLSRLGYGCDDFTIIEREDLAEFKTKIYNSTAFDTIQEDYQPFSIPNHIKIDDLRHIHNSFFPKYSYHAAVFYNKTKSNPCFITFIERKQQQHNEAMQHVYNKSGNLCWNIKEQKFFIQSKYALCIDIEEQKSYVIASLDTKILKIQSYTIEGKDLIRQLKTELRSLNLLCSTLYNRIYITEEWD